MAVYRMTAARKAALRKAQLASARKRKGKKTKTKRYSSSRGSYARKADKMSRSKNRLVRAAAWLTRGNGGNGLAGGSIVYRISKARGKKAGKFRKN